jgi:hypothetical protein
MKNRPEPVASNEDVSQFVRAIKAVTAPAKDIPLRVKPELRASLVSHTDFCHLDDVRLSSLATEYFGQVCTDRAVCVALLLSKFEAEGL